MSDKRMISKEIFASGKFLAMPISARALYAYLVLYADDDGVVEGNSILKMTGCSDDDLKLLALKGYITILDNYNVSYIENWLRINYIRADRYKPSIYQNLLKEVRPDVPLIEVKQRADRKSLSNKNTQNKNINSNIDNEEYNKQLNNSWDGIKQIKLNKYNKQQHSDINQLLSLFNQLGISSSIKIFKRFDVAVILKQIGNLQYKLSQGYQIDNIAGWLFAACRDNYQVIEKQSAVIDSPKINSESKVIEDIQLKALKNGDDNFE